MSGVAHLFEPAEIVKAVLLERKITAQCGVVKRVTREDVDDLEASPCAECFAAVEADCEVFTIRARRGWVALLEHVHRERWTRGKVSLVVAADGAGWMVVTVLWATANAWVQDAESTASRGDGTFVAEQMRRARRAMKAGKRRARHG